MTQDPCEKIRFALDEKKKELEEIKLDIFTHNSRIQKLTQEITILEKTLKGLEEKD